MKWKLITKKIKIDNNNKIKIDNNNNNKKIKIDNNNQKNPIFFLRARSAQSKSWKLKKNP